MDVPYLLVAVVGLMDHFDLPDLPAKKAQKVVVNKEVVESFVAPEPVVSQDEEIVAVIAAAIAAAESESGGLAKFRVVSFRRS